MEQIGVIAGFVLTLMVFSYLLGDNFLYRVAVYIFVGLTAGFITVIVWTNIIMPWVSQTIITSIDEGDTILLTFGFVPILLATLVLLKTSSYLGGLGNIAIAILVGVGSAVALVGAVTGTLIPLVLNVGNTPNMVNNVIIAVGVVTTLIYFQYISWHRQRDQEVKRQPIRPIGIIGQGFIITTLGALYATAIITSLTVFSERISFLMSGG